MKTLVLMSSAICEVHQNWKTSVQRSSQQYARYSCMFVNFNHSMRYSVLEGDVLRRGLNGELLVRNEAELLQL